MRPYVGVLMGTPASPDFVVVGIAASERERAEVASICRESGVAQAELRAVIGVASGPEPAL